MQLLGMSQELICLDRSLTDSDDAVYLLSDKSVPYPVAYGLSVDVILIRYLLF